MESSRKQYDLQRPGITQERVPSRCFSPISAAGVDASRCLEAEDELLDKN